MNVNKSHLVYITMLDQLILAVAETVDYEWLMSYERSEVHKEVLFYLYNENQRLQLSITAINDKLPEGFEYIGEFGEVWE